MSFEVLGTSAQLQITIARARTRDWAVSIRNNCFQKIVEHDHSGVSGKGVQLSTTAIANDAITGLKIRLANDQYLRARNAADNADINIVKVSSGNEVVFGTTIATADFQDDGLTISDNADNTKKIALNAGNITTGTTRTISAPDANGTLVLEDNTATLSNKTIASASNTLTIDADVSTVSNIKNAEIKAGAAIDLNKLAATTASRALVSDGSGFVSPATTTATEIGYVNGVTSAIQTQLNAKLPTTITTTGDIIYSSSGTTASRLGIGSSGQVLTVSGGLPVWGTNTVAAIAPISKSTTYTATTDDDLILCDTAGGAWTLSLYTAVSNAGRRIRIRKTTSDWTALTIDGDGTETIDGAATIKLHQQHEEVVLVSDNTNWLIESHRYPSVWTAYTPDIRGLGTETGVNFIYKRVGDTIKINGKFTTGTVAASEIQIDLPNTLTIATSGMGVVRVVGQFYRTDNNTSPIYSILATAGDTFFNASSITSAIDTDTPQTGSALLSNSTGYEMFAEVKILDLLG